MITLSLDVYESKDYANLYRAWVRLNKFYLFKKNMNLNTEYFFIVRETCYRSEQTFFFTPSKWLSHCPDFRTFVIELRMQGVAIASHYVRLIKKIGRYCVNWHFYSPSLSDHVLIERIKSTLLPSNYLSVPFPEKQRERSWYANKLLESVEKSEGTI